MSLSFEYWTDPLCIWAYVAQSKLERLTEEVGDTLVVSHRVIPIFGSIPRRFASGSWAEAGPEGRAEATARIARDHPRPGGPEITGQVWVDAAPTSSWSASMAAKGVAAMEAAEEAPTGAAGDYLWALRRAFYEDNLDVTGRAAQVQVAEALDIDVTALVRRLDDGSALASVYEDFEDKEALKLRGSPSYVFDGGRTVIYGNFDYDVLLATVRALLDGPRGGGTVC